MINIKKLNFEKINNENNKSNYPYTERKEIKYTPFHKKTPINNECFTLNYFLKKKNFQILNNNYIKKIILNFKRNKSIPTNSTTLKKNYSLQNLKSNLSIKNSFINNYYNNNNEKNNELIINKNHSLNYLPLINKNYHPKTTRLTPNFNYNYQIKSASDFSYSNPKKSVFTNFISSMKIRGAYNRSVKGSINPLTIKAKNYQKKKNMDTCFSKTNFISKKLGQMSTFGVFNGIGKDGNKISKILKEFFMDYFENNLTIKTTSEKDNFYSILIKAFNDAEIYLKNNIIINNPLNKNYVDLDFNGVTTCIVVYPNNNKNKLFVANIGDCQCILYTNSNYIKCCYTHNWKRPSERDRIEKFTKLNENMDILKQKLEDKDNKIFNGITLNIIKEQQLKEIKDKFKENFIKNFKKLDITRCLGIFSTKSIGIINSPEIIEIDLKESRGKFMVLGTNSLWKFMTYEEVGLIVRKYSKNNNTYGACLELEEVARERWKKKCRCVEDITLVVIFLEWKR